MKKNSDNKVPVADDNDWWTAGDVRFRYKGKKNVAKVSLYDDKGHTGTYLVTLKKGEVYPDPKADVFDPEEPERIFIDPGSDTFERMVNYINHKAIF